MGGPTSQRLTRATRIGRHRCYAGVARDTRAGRIFTGFLCGCRPTERATPDPCGGVWPWERWRRWPPGSAGPSRDRPAGLVRVCATDDHDPCDRVAPSAPRPGARASEQLPEDAEEGAALAVR